MDMSVCHAYYNEHDEFAAAWLRELIKDGLIADGVVDERDIQDVEPNDLRKFTQVHFFAGIGGWSYALRLATWPDDQPVWTGSCPCQPFSTAGRGAGVDDERHLWPAFRWLIEQCRPTVVFGEQVASKLGREWLANLQDDLENMGYAGAGADLCAAGVGAPHIRQRLFWVADSRCNGEESERSKCRGTSGGNESQTWERQRVRIEYSTGGTLSGLADSKHQQREGCLHRCESNSGPERRGATTEFTGYCETKRLVDSDQPGPQRRSVYSKRGDQQSPWSSGVAYPCSDGRSRLIEPSIFPLAHGVPNRMGTLRGAGNAIVPEVAATFIEAYMQYSDGLNK